jgi:hypothetical protein
MHRKFLIVLFIIPIALLFNSCNYINKKLIDFVNYALTDTTYTVELPQKIGGVLICKVHYSDDFKSWDYDIHYTYKDKHDSLYEIGDCRYSGMDWKKDEQLVKFNDWIILKTACFKGEKVIIGKLESKKFFSYELTPEFIEKEEKWKQLKLNSSSEYNDSETHIEKVDSIGEIFVKYHYRIEGRIIFRTGKKFIKYIIDNKTGQPKIDKIINED